MSRQVVPSTDKSCQEDFLKSFFKRALPKSVKITKKAMPKHIGSNTDKIISKAFLICFKALYEMSNEKLLL